MEFRKQCGTYEVPTLQLAAKSGPPLCVTVEISHPITDRRPLLQAFFRKFFGLEIP